MGQFNAALHNLPTEVLIQISRLLPYASRSNLSMSNRKFHNLLGPEIKHEGTALRQIYRSLAVSADARTREPVLFELLLDLLRGHITGNMVEALVYAPTFAREGFRDAHFSSTDEILLKNTINRLPWADNRRDLITQVCRGQGWSVLAVILPFLTSLRYIWLPINWATSDRPSLKQSMTSIIHNNLLATPTSRANLPLGRLTHLRIGNSRNSEADAHLLNDICLLLDLPSLRVLYAENVPISEQAVYAAPAKSRVESVVLINCWFCERELADRIGVPCIIYTEMAYPPYWDLFPDLDPLDETTRQKFTISGQVDADTGFILPESKKITVAQYTKRRCDEMTTEFSQIGDCIAKIENTFWR